MNRFQKWTLALGTSLFILLGGAAEAYEPYYLNGNKDLPMIGNTGGIYNDGNTGLFLKLSTVEIEDVFEDGLQARVRLLQVSSGQTAAENWLHVRYDVEGKAWALGQDRKWREIPSDSEDPSQRAVSFIREELGNDARRDVLSGQILKIMDKKKDKLGKAAPHDALPLMAEEIPAEPSVKGKGKVAKADSSDRKETKADSPSEPSDQVKKPDAETVKKEGTVSPGEKEPEPAITVVSINSSEDSSVQTAPTEEAPPAENSPEIPAEGILSGGNSPETTTEPALETFGKPAVDENESASPDAAADGRESSPEDGQTKAAPKDEPSGENSQDVIVTIMGGPRVEIIETPPPQVDVTVTKE